MYKPARRKHNHVVSLQLWSRSLKNAPLPPPVHKVGRLCLRDLAPAELRIAAGDYHILSELRRPERAGSVPALVPRYGNMLAPMQAVRRERHERTPASQRKTSCSALPYPGLGHPCKRPRPPRRRVTMLFLLSPSNSAMPRFGFSQLDSVRRDRVAKPYLSIRRFHIVVLYDVGMAAFRRGAGHPRVNDERVVPTLVDFFVLVIDDIGVGRCRSGVPTVYPR